MLHATLSEQVGNIIQNQFDGSDNSEGHGLLYAKDLLTTIFEKNDCFEAKKRTKKHLSLKDFEVSICLCDQRCYFIKEMSEMMRSLVKWFRNVVFFFKMY